MQHLITGHPVGIRAQMGPNRYCGFGPIWIAMAVGFFSASLSSPACATIPASTSAWASAIAAGPTVSRALGQPPHISQDIRPLWIIVATVRSRFDEGFI